MYISKILALAACAILLAGCVIGRPRMAVYGQNGRIAYSAAVDGYGSPAPGYRRPGIRSNQARRYYVDGRCHIGPNGRWFKTIEVVRGRYEVRECLPPQRAMNTPPVVNGRVLEFWYNDPHLFDYDIPYGYRGR
jgi:hypothetical protein